MPWTRDSYPLAMSHLTETVRAKAIDIANALLRENVEEGQAIRIGIAKARAWALDQGIPSREVLRLPVDRRRARIAHAAVHSHLPASPLLH